MSTEDKYKMFKNYMHNELEITREDIKTWIEDAIRIEANRLVKTEYRRQDIKKTVKDEIKKILIDKDLLGDSFSYQVRKDIADAIVKKIDLNLK